MAEAFSTVPGDEANKAAHIVPRTVKMVKLTIEGRPVSVPDGTSILEAAKVAGVLIPHYCYHPGLPVAGVCRMCLVEVEKFPKLAPSCATTVGEGQVVHVHSPKALEARKGVLEFLLINHPLDCPICDQAGECELQDYTFAEGRADSRYREPKRFNPVEDFGGDVLYVQNRCILCTRCVRFMDDVAQDPVLNVSERGDRAFDVHQRETSLFPGLSDALSQCSACKRGIKSLCHRLHIVHKICTRGKIMAIYVDNEQIAWRGKTWCHLVADSLEELHAFALELGLRRAWFQDQASYPHYDVTVSVRERALAMGALHGDRRTIVGCAKALKVQLTAVRSANADALAA